MIVSPREYSPTRVIGMASFGAAGISSGIAWFRAERNSNIARTAGCVTILEAFLFLDIIFDWRWTLHAALIHFALIHAWYGQRRLVQTAALIVSGSLVAYSIRLVFQRDIMDWGIVFAVLCAFLSLVCWCVEVISLHEVDAVLYHKTAEVMTVALIWLALSAITAVSIHKNK